MESFMNLPLLFASAFVIGLSGAMMPGPVLTYVVNGSLRKGFWAGPMVITGHSILELLLVILLLSGLSGLFAAPLFTALVGIIGGLFLIFMAINMIKSVKQATLNLEQQKAKEINSNKYMLAGALISLSNPYWIIWWATIGITYLVSAQKQGIVGVGTFLTGHLAADFAWYSLISFVVSKGKKFISDRVYRILIILFSLFLIYFALLFIHDGLQHFGIF